MIFHGTIVEQAIDRHERGRFVKELVVTGGRVPLAMVRKRWADNDGATRAPLLLVHGFGQNRYAWHLPSRSMANFLAREGYDVFNLDLRGHGRSRHLGARRCKSLADYVREDLPAALDEVTKLSGGRPVWAIGHSLGGLVTYAAAPELRGALAGIASIGSPYHFTRGSLSLGAVRLLLRGFRTAGLPIVNWPIGVNSFGTLLRIARPIAESPVYPLPVRGWHKGALEPHVLDEHLRLAFDSAGLWEMFELFEWPSSRRHTELAERFEQLDIPLLVIAGTHDDLAPAASVRPGWERSRSSDKVYREYPLGHIDLLVGRDAPRMTWATVTDFLAKRAA